MHVQHEHDGNWETILIESIDKISDIRDAWEQLLYDEALPNVDTDIDRYLSIVKSLKNTTPFLLLLQRNNRPVSLAIGWISPVKIKCKVGYLNLFSPTLKCLSIVYGGILGEKSNEVCRLTIKAIEQFLKSGKADVAEFNHLQTDSITYQYAASLPNIFCRGYFCKIDTHWTMDVPEDLATFFNRLSSKHRKNLRRTIRKLESNYETNVTTARKARQLEPFIQAAENISLKTYQHALDSGFINNEMTRNLLTTAANRDWLRLDILYIDKIPCAFQLGLKYSNTYFLQQLGYDPKWTKLSIGTTLFVKIMKELCEDPEIKIIDFGFGDAPYKKSYGTKQWPETTTYIFASRFYPIWVNLIKSLTMGLSIGMTTVLASIGMEQQIKRLWRNRLAKQATRD